MQTAESDTGGGSLGMRVDKFHDILARSLVIGGILEKSRKGARLELRGKELLAVERGIDAVALDMQIHIVPASGLHFSGCSDKLRLTAVDDLLDGILRIAPAANVQPAIVVGVDIVEHDEGDRCIRCRRYAEDSDAAHPRKQTAD